jgi:micrococcal nuclease
MRIRRCLVGLAASALLVGCLAGCRGGLEVATEHEPAAGSSDRVWVDADEALEGSETSAREAEPLTEDRTAPGLEQEPSTGNAVPPGLPDGVEAAVVSRIVDGDTLELRGKPGGTLLPTGGVTSVRLLEIDTPETKHPSEPRQCYGAEATERLTKLAPPGHPVWVLADQELLDPYDRHLLYLWTLKGGQPIFVNEALVAGGYAAAVLYEPNDLYIEKMRRAERQARAASLGMWGECSSLGEPLVAEPKSARSNSRPAMGAAVGRCDPSYPGVCIPRGGDLDCPDVPFTSFRVLSPDPHGFDADGDGLGCVG